MGALKTIKNIFEEQFMVVHKINVSRNDYVIDKMTM